MQEKTAKVAPKPETGLLGPAAARLNAAVEACEKSLGGQQDTTREMEALRDEIVRLTEDRTGLARELEDARTRIEQLETVHGEVSDRLDRALGTVRSLTGSVS